MKRPVPSIAQAGILLRSIREEDLPTTLAWRNRPGAREWFKSTQTISLQQHSAWFKQYVENDNDFLFIVEADGVSVGQASVYNIDWRARTAEVGRFLVAPDAAGQGFINRACAALIQLCTEQFGLRHLYLEVFENNARAIRLYAHHGFKETARQGALIRMELNT